MNWPALFELIGKAISACAAAAGAWWALDKWRRRDEHFPRIYFEVSINFLGEHESQTVVELVAVLANNGVVPLRIHELGFEVLGLKSTDPLVRGGPDIREQIRFPHLVEKGRFVPEDWGYTFIYPGVKTEYNFVSSIPPGFRFLRIQGDFAYSRGRTHHAAKILEVPRYEKTQTAAV